MLLLKMGKKNPLKLKGQCLDTKSSTKVQLKMLVGEGIYIFYFDLITLIVLKFKLFAAVLRFCNIESLNK